MKIIFSSRRYYYVARVIILLAAIALVVGMVSCDDTSQNLEIRTWYDLDAVSNNLSGSYILLNDLNSTTAGYTGLASETADQGKGWQPIGTKAEPFAGTFNGQGYEIRDLFINRPNEHYVGLFGYVDEASVIENVGVMNADVTGEWYVGGLVGENDGTVRNSHSTGNVIGNSLVGGLAGANAYSGTVSNSYSTSNVTGYSSVGGLAGTNAYSGTVSTSYSTGTVSGSSDIGGLVGHNFVSTVNDSYSMGNVNGDCWVGGLVGLNEAATVSNSYSSANVTGNSGVGGLVGGNDSFVSNSFWDMETSGQSTSDGGTGKNTTDMQDISTFSGATWDIVAVGNPNTRNPAYTWNIVDDVTYPFLSWEPVS